MFELLTGILRIKSIIFALTGEAIEGGKNLEWVNEITGKRDRFWEEVKDGELRADSITQSDLVNQLPSVTEARQVESTTNQVARGRDLVNNLYWLSEWREDISFICRDEMGNEIRLYRRFGTSQVADQSNRRLTL